MPLNINFQQILLHMFNFVILAFGLYMLLYKPVTTAMRATRLAVGEQHKGTNKNTIIVTIVSLAVIAAALAFFFTVLGAKLGG